jgi:catechol 2,3-dioxygenase-like lactoylglutathione lyase family enzyme
MPDAAKSVIVAPVMRHLGTADAVRAVAFYCDVLGFDMAEEREVVCGPARICFTKEDWDLYNTESGPRGSAIVFFQAADVASLHAAVKARGGAPSDLEKVNWIKMQVFQIQDPDGHTLWFGQSFDQPCQPVPKPALQKALPMLPLNDVSAGIRHYCDVLGFKINYQQEDLGVMYRDEVTILLIARTDQFKGIGATEFYIENADALYAEFRSRGADVQGEPVSHPWGLRDFRVLDPEGNVLVFAQAFE